MPRPCGKSVKMSCFVEAEHVCNLPPNWYSSYIESTRSGMASNGLQSKPVFLGEGFVAGHIANKLTKGLHYKSRIVQRIESPKKARLVGIWDKNVVSKYYIPDRIIDLESLTHRESNEWPWSIWVQCFGFIFTIAAKPQKSFLLSMLKGWVQIERRRSPESCTLPILVPPGWAPIYQTRYMWHHIKNGVLYELAAWVVPIFSAPHWLWVRNDIGFFPAIVSRGLIKYRRRDQFVWRHLDESLTSQRTCTCTRDISYLRALAWANISS